MATAKRGTVKTKIDMEGVVLTLTLSEAQTLADALAAVGGDAEKSRPRKRVDDILKALGKSGVQWYNHPELKGNLVFEKPTSRPEAVLQTYKVV